MPRLTPLCLALGLLSGIGCGAPRTLRQYADVTWDTVWSTGGALPDSTLPSPSLLTFGRGEVFAFDDAARRLVALDSRNGAVLWQTGRQGQGPSEFLGVAALLPDPAGGVAVLDIQNRRLVRVGADGAVAGSISLAAIGQQPNQICAHRGNRYLVADVVRPALREMDAAGELIRERTPLWPEFAGAAGGPPQLLLRNDPAGDRCAVAVLTGRGFALSSPGRKDIVRPYIEDFEAFGLGPRRTEPEPSFLAVSDAEIIADTLMVLFVGRTADRYRVVDRYLATTGAYLDSYRLPFPTAEFAAGDGDLFVVDSSATKIIALRPRRR